MTQPDQPAKDQRRWAKFPIDMHRDPKIARLATDVKWTFLEMNLDARAESNDGVFEQEDAEFRWSPAHLDALVAPTPPRRSSRGARTVPTSFAGTRRTS